MFTQNSHSANAATSLFNVVPGALYGQVNSGDPKTLSKLGKLFVPLVPPGAGILGANLIVYGQTAGFQRFVRDITQAGPLIVNPLMPEGRHLKAPVLGLTVQTSNTMLVLAPDPASHYVRQHYRQWVKTGEVLIDLIPPSRLGCCRLTISMRDVDTDLNGWPQHAHWEPDPMKRMRQVVQALQAASPVEKTVVVSVVELQLQ